MSKVICSAVVLLFASALFAESPMVGTWKLDAAKSKFSRGDLPKGVTLVIEQKGEDLLVSASGTNGDGSPLSIKYTIPEKGGAGTLQEGGAYDGLSSKLVSTDVRENTYTKNGKIVTTRRNVVSKDGKTMRSTVKGINMQGKPISGTEVFEKQ